MMKPAPTHLWIKEGATITNNGREYVIVALADINLVLAKEVGSGEKALLKIGDLEPPRPIGGTETKPKPESSLWDIPRHEWEIAEERRRIITPLLRVPLARWADGLAAKLALEAGISRATIYRWGSTYRKTGLLSCLLSRVTERDGKERISLSPEGDAIIADCIVNFFDTEQKPSFAVTVEEIRRRCANAKLKLPAANTIRNRIEAGKGRDRIKKRMGETASHDDANLIFRGHLFLFWLRFRLTK